MKSISAKSGDTSMEMKDNESGQGEGLLSAAEDILKAIAAKDAKALAVAIQAAVSECDDEYEA